MILQFRVRTPARSQLGFGAEELREEIGRVLGCHFVPFGKCGELLFRATVLNVQVRFWGPDDDDMFVLDGDGECPHQDDSVYSALDIGRAIADLLETSGVGVWTDRYGAQWLTQPPAGP